MGHIWYKAHYIRKNYNSLYEKYRGKSVVFLFKDFNDLVNLRITDQNDITATVKSIEDGLFKKTHYDPYGNNRVYFPLENEYKELLQNYREKTKVLSFERPNVFDFNLDSYFENEIEIFPNPEIDEAIIERIEVYIDKKRKIMNKIDSQREGKEILKNISNLGNFYYIIYKTPDITNSILENLLTKLLMRGSQKVMVYLKENPFSILRDIGNPLGQYFDYKEQISKEFMNFILSLYKEKNMLNLHTFIERMVFYNPERRKEIRNLLYSEDINLLEIYYGCMFRALDDEMPQSLKDKIPPALKTLENIDVDKIVNGVTKNSTNIDVIVIESYKQELRKIINDFIEKKMIKEKYREYLFSEETLDKKINDIQLRFTEEELIEPITDFLKTVLSNNSISYKEKDLVYAFLIYYDFKNFKELEPTIKEQLMTDINFDTTILYRVYHKIQFSEEELNELLNHPAFSIRSFVMRRFGKTWSDPEIPELRNFIPIIMYKGIPQFLGNLANDDRIMEKIDRLKQERYETIDDKKRIIKLTQEEMMELMTRENEYDIKDYEELLKEEDKKLEFYLLKDEKITERWTELRNKILNERDERNDYKNYLLKEYKNGN